MPRLHHWLQFTNYGFHLIFMAIGKHRVFLVADISSVTTHYISHDTREMPPKS